MELHPEGPFHPHPRTVYLVARVPAQRITVSDVTPQVDCGRWPAKACVGDRVDVAATIVRDGHETLRGVVRFRRSRARWREAPLESLGNDRFAGSFEVDAVGRWSFEIEAWVDRHAGWLEEHDRKVAAGQDDLAGELAEGAALFGTGSVDDWRKGADELGRRERHGAGAERGAPAGRRAGARPRRRLVRAVPALVGRAAGRDPGRARARAARVRRPLPAADPPHRTDEPEGEEQHRAGGARRRRQPLGDRRPRGWARRDRPWSRGRGRPREAGRGTARARDGARARPRAAVLARPPLARTASGVVPAPAGRLAEVRREPAQALPGHPQLRLGHARPEGPLACRSATWSTAGATRA